MTLSITEITHEPMKVIYASLTFEKNPIPIVVASGKRTGPTLLVVGMQHGTEFSGPGAIDRVLDEINLELMSGSLVCLPIVNPFHAKLTLDEHKQLWKNPETNLNRQWPGDPASPSPLSRLAAFIWNSAIAKADAILDMHCCRPIDPRFAACLEGHTPSEKLAISLGLEAVDRQTPTSYHERQLHIVAAQRRNIPAVLVESHPSLFQPREAVQACTGAIVRAMIHLEMLPPSFTFVLPVPCESVFRRSTPGLCLNTNQKGYLGIRRWAGDDVRKGETVAVVRSLETFEVIERLESPAEGAVSCAGHPAGEALIEPGVTVVVIKPKEPAQV